MSEGICLKAILEKGSDRAVSLSALEFSKEMRYINLRLLIYLLAYLSVSRRLLQVAAESQINERPP